MRKARWCEAKVESERPTFSARLELMVSTYVNAHAEFVGAWQQSVF